MTLRKTPSQSPNPFTSFQRPNPFAEAMPARMESGSTHANREPSWGPYGAIETLDDNEEEIGDEQTLEILITWGSSVLHVAHLSPPRDFVVGDESDGSGEPVDFHLPENVLGRKRLPLIAMEDGVPLMILPDIARGTLEVDQQKHDLRSIVDEAPGCPTVTRAKQHALDERTRMKMQLGEVEFFLRLVPKSAPIEKGLLANFDSAVPSYFGMTAGIATAFMGAMAYFVPPLGLVDESAIDKERLMTISHYLDQLAEREQERQEEPAPEPGAQSDEGKQAKNADGAQGKAGKDDGPQVVKRVAVKGPRDNAQVQLSKHEAIKMAQTFGMIGILNQGIASDPNAPTSIFGQDVAIGNDDLSAQGNLWADEIGDAIGSNGLHLFGPGPGGNFGDGTGIGIGSIGDGIGPGFGKHGWGRSAALTKGGHTAKAPNPIRPGATQVSGRLPAHIVQRIVRQNFGRFRMCYQQGLARNPGLEGRIPVRFVIGRDGAVSNVGTSGGFPDSQVQSCVQSAFYGLSFPPPEGGIVQVTYPLIFSPS